MGLVPTRPQSASRASWAKAAPWGLTARGGVRTAQVVKVKGPLSDHVQWANSMQNDSSAPGATCGSCSCCNARSPHLVHSPRCRVWYRWPELHGQEQQGWDWSEGSEPSFRSFSGTCHSCSYDPLGSLRTAVPWPRGTRPGPPGRDGDQAGARGLQCFPQSPSFLPSGEALEPVLRGTGMKRV